MNKEIKAKLKYLRIAPRKVRLVADLIRGRKAEEAAVILKFIAKRAAKPISKLLHSALANAENNFQAKAEKLYISKITVDEAPKMKRWRARSRGRSMQIQKKSSHITIILEEEEKTEQQSKIQKEQKDKLVDDRAKPLKTGL